MREELRATSRASDTSVDFDAGLNSAMRKLRDALDDSAENPRFVETLPRRGYRFIGSAAWVTVDEVPKPISGRTAAGHIRSLAVVPFVSLTGDSSQEYFVDGMTDALTTDLAEVGRFDVIARTSAMRYKGAKRPLSAIGRELNVDGTLSDPSTASTSRRS